MREVHVKFIQYSILVYTVSLFNGRPMTFEGYKHSTHGLSIEERYYKLTLSMKCVKYAHEERSSREVHSVYTSVFSLQWCEVWRVEGFKRPFHWREIQVGLQNELHVNFSLWNLPMYLSSLEEMEGDVWRLQTLEERSSRPPSLFNGPMCGLHTFIGRETFTWSSYSTVLVERSSPTSVSLYNETVKYEVLTSHFHWREKFTWRLSSNESVKYAHVWSVCSKHWREIQVGYTVYPTCISLQWKATFEGYKHCTSHTFIGEIQIVYTEWTSQLLSTNETVKFTLYR